MSTELLDTNDQALALLEAAQSPSDSWDDLFAAGFENADDLPAVDADPADLDAVAPAEEAPAEPVVLKTTVELDGETIQIEEPTIEDIVEAGKFVGSLILSGNRVVGTQMRGLFMAVTSSGKITQQVPIEATVGSILYTLSVPLIQKLSHLILFGASRENKARADAFFKDHPYRIAPVIEALAIRLALSDDLRQSLKNFSLVGQYWNATSPAAKAKSPTPIS